MEQERVSGARYGKTLRKFCRVARKLPPNRREVTSRLCRNPRIRWTLAGLRRPNLWHAACPWPPAAPVMITFFPLSRSIDCSFNDLSAVHLELIVSASWTFSGFGTFRWRGLATHPISGPDARIHVGQRRCVTTPAQGKDEDSSWSEWPGGPRRFSHSASNTPSYAMR